MASLKTDKDFYEELAQKRLSDEEVAQAKQSFVGFFDLLYQIDRRKKAEAKQQESFDLSSAK